MLNILINRINPILNDAPKAWGIYFQDGATPSFEGIVELHDHIMFYLIIVLFGVGYMMVSIMRIYSSNSTQIVHKYLNHGTLIELIWTISPALVLVAIAFPSFKLLYLMDDVFDPAMTIKVVGFFIFLITLDSLLKYIKHYKLIILYNNYYKRISENYLSIYGRNQNSKFTFSGGLFILPENKFLIWFLIIDIILFILYILFFHKRTIVNLRKRLSNYKEDFLKIEFIRGIIEVHNKSFLPKWLENLHNNYYVKSLRFINGTAALIILLNMRMNLNLNLNLLAILCILAFFQFSYMSFIGVTKIINIIKSLITGEVITRNSPIAWKTVTGKTVWSAVKIAGISGMSFVAGICGNASIVDTWLAATGRDTKAWPLIGKYTNNIIGSPEIKDESLKKN